MKVLSVGGSVLAPDGVDMAFVEALISSIEKGAILVVGGGKAARTMISADDRLSDEAKDRIGIAATRMNARFLIEELLAAGIDVCPEVLVSTDIPSGYDVYCMGGLTPGRTTDDVAMQMAIAHDAPIVVNCTNVDGVYDKDPREPGAKKYATLSWDSYLEMFPAHTPGLHAPFDPTAAARAQKHGITVLVVDGRQYVKGCADGTRLS